MPIPPSINAQLCSSRGRLIKTNEARAFDNAIYVYSLKTRRDLLGHQEKVKKWISEGLMLRVDCYFSLLKTEVFSKKGDPKAKDQNNFLKSSLDAVAKLIEVDDKYFFSNICEKVICKRECDRYATIIINNMVPRTKEEMLDDIK
jgi:hypothetical protein